MKITSALRAFRYASITTAATILPLALTGCGQARALEGFHGCHGPAETVIAISDVNTAHAKMTTEITIPDAMESCNRESNDNNMSHAALMGCVKEELANGHQTNVWANCKKGTLVMDYGDGPHRFKFPTDQTCSTGGPGASVAMKTLCPDYQGKLELE